MGIESAFRISNLIELIKFIRKSDIRLITGFIGVLRISSLFIIFIYRLKV